MKYRTIVADPPWDYGGMSPPWRSSTRPPYPLMPLADIKALPVPDLAERDAHLYVWAVVPLLEQAYAVVRHWGFRPSTLVTWCKRGPGLGGGWRCNTEHLIAARRGNLPYRGVLTGTWYVAPRTTTHSQKPDVFLDLIEQASHPAYVELFARRQRLGWDTWGNEAFKHVELEA